MPPPATQCWHWRRGGKGVYSTFGIGVVWNHALKWLFSQEKAALHSAQKVYVYSKSALRFLRRIRRNLNRDERIPSRIADHVELRLVPIEHFQALLHVLHADPGAIAIQCGGWPV